jgi:putative transposon-encoded protein
MIKQDEFIPMTLERTAKTCGNSCHIQIPRKYLGKEVTVMIKEKKKSRKEIDKEVYELTEDYHDV